MCTGATVRKCATAPVPLSDADAFECYIKLLPTKFPCDTACRHNSLTTCSFLPLCFHVAMVCTTFYPFYFIRPHRSTTYVDAANSYRPSSVVCRSVCLSVCHTSEPCKNGCTDRAAVWVEDLGGLWEPHIRWRSRSPMERGKFLGENGRPIVKYRDTLRSSVQRRLNR